MIVIGDTSGLVAALNIDNPEHDAARTAFRQSPATVVSPLVMAEIEHIVTRLTGRNAAYMVNDALLHDEEIVRVVIPEIDAAALRKARRIQNKYRDLRLDLADAVNVVLAEVYETDTVLTLDRRDFRAVTPLTGHRSFRLLPDDL